MTAKNLQQFFYLIVKRDPRIVEIYFNCRFWASRYGSLKHVQERDQISAKETVAEENIQRPTIVSIETRHNDS